MLVRFVIEFRRDVRASLDNVTARERRRSRTKKARMIGRRLSDEETGRGRGNMALETFTIAIVLSSVVGTLPCATQC